MQTSGSVSDASGLAIAFFAMYALERWQVLRFLPEQAQPLNRLLNLNFETNFSFEWEGANFNQLVKLIDTQTNGGLGRLR